MFLRVPLVLVALLLASCAATSHRYYFRPSPFEVLIEPAGGGVLARALVSVPGAKRAGGERDGQPEMQVRIRFENKTAYALVFDAASALLVGSDLQTFGPARCEEGTRVEIPGHEAVSVHLAFPFPDGVELRGHSLDGLNLQWNLEHAGQVLETSITLDRMPRPTWPYDDYGESRFFISLGYFGHGC